MAWSRLNNDQIVTGEDLLNAVSLNLFTLKSGQTIPNNRRGLKRSQVMALVNVTAISGDDRLARKSDLIAAVVVPPNNPVTTTFEFLIEPRISSGFQMRFNASAPPTFYSQTNDGVTNSNGISTTTTPIEGQVYSHSLSLLNNNIIQVRIPLVFTGTRAGNESTLYIGLYKNGALINSKTYTNLELPDGQVDFLYGENPMPILSTDVFRITVGQRYATEAFISNNPLDWEQGSMSAATAVGSPYSTVKSTSTTRIRVKTLVPIGTGFKVYFNANTFHVYLRFFDASGLYLGTGSVNDQGTFDFLLVSPTQYNNAVAFVGIAINSATNGVSNGNVIVPSQITQVGLHIEKI